MKIDLITPHIMGNEKQYLLDAIDSNWVAPLGPYVKRFEEAIANYVGAKRAVAVNSGTAAIHAALLAVGVQPGDRVAVADLTFIASVNPIAYIGAIPVFIDSEKTSYNLDPKALELAAIQYKLKAVIVPHLYGTPADMLAIKQICHKHNIILIEDATEALGSTYFGIKAGMVGDIGCFSFNGNKIITSSGGGMIVTNNDEYADKAFHYATQARTPGLAYDHDEIGYNYRLSNLCAAVGLAQFENIGERILLKREIYKLYCQGLEYGVEMLPDMDGTMSNRWISCAVLKRPVAAELVKALAKKDIEARLVWKPLHDQRPYKGSAFVSMYGDNSTASQRLFRYGICLPSDTKMRVKEQCYVIDCVNEFMKEAMK